MDQLYIRLSLAELPFLEVLQQYVGLRKKYEKVLMIAYTINFSEANKIPKHIELYMFGIQQKNISASFTCLDFLSADSFTILWLQDNTLSQSSLWRHNGEETCGRPRDKRVSVENGGMWVL